MNSDLIASKGHYYDMVKSTHDDLQNSEQPHSDDEIDQAQALEGKTSSRKGSLEVFNDAVEEELNQQKDRVDYWKSLKQILKLLKPDWLILAIAVKSAIILGSSLPIFAVIFSEIYGVSSNGYKFAIHFINN